MHNHCNNNTTAPCFPYKNIPAQKKNISAFFQGKKQEKLIAVYILFAHGVFIQKRDQDHSRGVRERHKRKPLRAL